MHSKTKGNITEMCVMADIAKQGYQILLPFGENCRYDILVDDGNSFVKVQCKTGRVDRGTVLFSTARSYKNTRYTKDEVDVFAIYCLATENIYYVPWCEKRVVRLRTEPAKNGQIKLVNMADEFRKFPSRCSSVGRAPDL